MSPIKLNISMVSSISLERITFFIFNIIPPPHRCSSPRRTFQAEDIWRILLHCLGPEFLCGFNGFIRRIISFFLQANEQFEVNNSDIIKSSLKQLINSSLGANRNVYKHSQFFYNLLKGVCMKFEKGMQACVIKCPE